MTYATAISEDQIRDTIYTLLGQIAPEANLDRLSPTANVREELDIDSFDLLNLLIALNEEFGVEIPERDYGQLTTVDETATYIAARL